MKVHFIAIGGSVMHNLAIALHKKGYEVTGSDDQIFEPSYSRLKNVQLLPDEEGWNKDRIHPQLDAVILGMHAKPDNQELQKARELKLPIYSFPKYLYEQTKEKKRIVIGGSHGKTTITSMVMHVLKDNQIGFDYMVGSQIKGFDTMVRLEKENRIAVFEGDEYLSSPIDPTPKFHVYRPHIALISGIAWDHINVFPTFENYQEQFSEFSRRIEDNGTLIYYREDPLVLEIARNARGDIQKLGYTLPSYTQEEDNLYLRHNQKYYPLRIFGSHNLQNLEGARLICEQVGVSREQFYHSIQSFEGASRRLELIAENGTSRAYMDFAHAPSKLNATVKAVKEMYPGKKLIACMELHTFSSLNHNFLSEYSGTMHEADCAYVFYSPEAIEHKGLAMLEPAQIQEAFGASRLKVFSDVQQLLDDLNRQDMKNTVLLFMSSGNFGGIDLKKESNRLLRG